MKIVPYSAEYESDCLRIFASNVGEFFAASEFEGYQSYLNQYATELPYFVVIESNEVIACGGYAMADGMATLSWGMVDRNHQGKSVGKYLLHYRLNALFNDFGEIPPTIDTSQKTRGFYEKYGFTLTGVVKNGYGDGLDKVYLVYNGNFS